MMLKMCHNTANLGLGWWLPCPDLRHRVCMPISRFLSWEMGSKGGQWVEKGGMQTRLRGLESPELVLGMHGGKGRFI